MTEDFRIRATPKELAKAFRESSKKDANPRS